MPKLKRIPEFTTEEKEQDFWAKADTTEYFDWSKAQRVTFPNLKPTTKPISIRLSETLLTELKRLANAQDVPYQSLMKVYLAERVALERGLRNGTHSDRRLQSANAQPGQSRKTRVK